MLRQPMVADMQESSPSDIAIPRLACVVVLLAVPALLWNRALLPALPGSRSGIEHLFDQLFVVGSVLSQLLAVTLALLLIKLVVASLGTFALGVEGRLMALPIGAAVGFLLVAGAVAPLDVEMHLLLSGLGTAALISCVRPALHQPTLRAAGLLVLLSALASFAYSSGRLLALKASVEALPREYAVARIIASAGQLFDFLGLVWVMAWLVLSKRVPHHRGDETGETQLHARTKSLARVTAALALGVTCALLARRGQTSTANFAEVVLARAMAALSREPSPIATAALGPCLDVVAVTFALLLLVAPKHIAFATRVAMALVLLGRCAPDIPAHCGLMTAGALLLIWHTPSPISRKVKSEPETAPGTVKSQTAAATSAP